MSVITMDQLLETDRFVIEEFFELRMNEPELSQELQDYLWSPTSSEQSYE